MTIVDRYLLFQFLKIFLVSFASFSGMFVVIHVFSNLDEVIDVAGSHAGVSNLIFDFYGPRVFDFFNQMAGVLILVSAVFAVALMQRRRETTAIEAAGITKARIARPVVLAAIGIIAIAAFCREFYIPQYKATLVRSLTNWTASDVVPMHYQKDFATGIMIQGDELLLGKNQITDVELTLPPQISPKILKIEAKQGLIQPASEFHSAGLKLQSVADSDRLQQLGDLQFNGQTVVYAPRMHDWLEEDQLFVAVDLNVQEMAYGSSLFRYSSLSEMNRSLKKPGRRFGLGDQVAIHQRVLKPLLELTLLLIGLPLVISQPDRNIFMAAALCTGIIIAIELTAMASHALGAVMVIRPAALAAWLPVILFFPLSAFSLRKLFD